MTRADLEGANDFVHGWQARSNVVRASAGSFPSSLRRPLHPAILLYLLQSGVVGGHRSSEGWSSAGTALI